jgi:hypothetical protein
MAQFKKNVNEGSIVAGRDVHLGDNTYYQATPPKLSKLKIIVMVMTKTELRAVAHAKVMPLELNTKFGRTKDDCDLMHHFADFYQKNMTQIVFESAYDEEPNHWKPFFLNTDGARNQPIQWLLDHILSKKELKIPIEYATLTQINALSSESIIETFKDKLKNSILIFDPVSLLIQEYREFLSGIYENAPVGGVIGLLSGYLPKDLRQYIKALVKQSAYRWHEETKNHNENFHLYPKDERMLEKLLLQTCSNLIEKEASKDKSFPKLNNQNPVSADTMRF